MTRARVARRTITRILNTEQMAYEERAGDYLDTCSPEVLRQIIRQSHIRGPVSGGVSEYSFEHYILRQIPGITEIYKPSDGGGESKSDRVFHYNGRRIRAQCKTPKTAHVKRKRDGTQTGHVSVGTTDKSLKVTPDGFEHETTWALRGDFDILVVPLWIFGCDERAFAFKRARDLVSPNRQLPNEQSRHFLNIQQKISFPNLHECWWVEGIPGLLNLLDETIGTPIVP